MSEVDYFQLSLEQARQADEHVSEIGGLPEITEAAEDLRTAIDQTRTEITGMEFASRFSREPTLADRQRHEGWGIVLHHISKDAFEQEGMAGVKRTELLARLQYIEYGLLELISGLVELRAEAKISEQEF